MQMSINRRSAIKQFLFVSAGMALIPSCLQDKSKPAVELKNFSITAEQESLLAELSEAIIPKTTSPGAKDISAHRFALKMMDDCRSKEDQEKFLAGLAAFEKQADKISGKSFVKQSADERKAVLTEMERDKESTDDAVGFYRTMKRLTIQAYSSSEFFLTKVQVYELIPGRYHGCVPVKVA
jgi:Gluconate 2-dehydrogenase subunit 3